MRDALPEIRKRGAELVVVGNGKPEYAADFRDGEKLDFPLYTDPDLRSYAAAGLRRSVISAINLRVVGHGLRAMRAGKRQGATLGDPWQQGGVFVIGPGNRVAFSYISEEAGDHPDVAEILSALPRSPRTRKKPETSKRSASRATAGTSRTKKKRS